MRTSLFLNRALYILQHQALSKLGLQRRKNNHQIITDIKRQSLTYLSQDALNELYEQVSRVEQESLPGILIEAGCALGGSAIVMATAKKPSRPLYVYDVFDMIPPPTLADGDDVHQRYEEIKSGKSAGINNEQYYGYINDLLKEVMHNFQRNNLPLKPNNIHLIQGLFQNTLYTDQNVAVAHIDGDWYESVKTCLERIEPHLILGGVLVIDDYHSWSGCRKAVDEYFRDKKKRYKFSYKSRLQVMRVK